MESTEFKFDIYKDYLLNEIKEEKHFINSCKRMIRSSYEYSEWTKYIKFTLGIENCVFTNETSKEVTIEIHHHPISIENIIKIIYDKYMSDISIDTISSSAIIEEVLNLHKSDNVGYVPLVTTLHEKFHNGYLDIPMEYVHGNWQYILNNYTIYDNDIKEVINKYTSVIKNNTKVWYIVNPETSVLEVA